MANDAVTQRIQDMDSYKLQLRDLVEGTILHLEHVSTFDEFSDFLRERIRMADLTAGMLQTNTAA